MPNGSQLNSDGQMSDFRTAFPFSGCSPNDIADDLSARVLACERP